MSKNFITILVFALLGITVCVFALPQQEGSINNTKINIQDEHQDFNTMMDVVTHQRCMNCHPNGDRPRQGEDSHIHYFNVQRGEDGHGIGSLKCVTCHRDENNASAGIPGAPHWHLAPISMAWEGLTRAEIATSILDKDKNGNRSLDDIVKHMTEDDLVLWAFDPGVNNEGIPREKPPVSKEDFIAAVKNWAKAGAIIPQK